MARIIILCLFLSGCGGEYVKPTHYADTVIHTWERTDNPDYDCGINRRQGERIKGCAQYWRVGREEAYKIIDKVVDKLGYIIVCKTLSPQVRYPGDDYMMTLGHEANHCFTGNFHD